MSEPRDLYDSLLDEASKVLIGNEEVIQQLTISLLTRGHVLMEGVPGVAKTTVANLFARTIGLSYNRVQMTPDILPADITGTHVYREATGDFTLQHGPIFSNVVVADEINRATPKTQSALLEAMQERHVTIEGETTELPSPFMVIATQNPIEMEGSLHPDESLFMDGRLWQGSDALTYAREQGEVVHETDETTFFDVDATTQTLTESGRVESRECFVYKQSYDGHLYTVRTATGREIMVTGNHPFLVNRRGRLLWVDAEDLDRADHLVTPRTIDAPSRSFRSHDETLERLREEYREVGDRFGALAPHDAGFVVGVVVASGSSSDERVRVTADGTPDAFERWVDLVEGVARDVEVQCADGRRTATVDSAPFVAYLRTRYHLDEPTRLVSAPEPFRRSFVEAVVGATAESDPDRGVVTVPGLREETANVLAHVLLQFGVTPQFVRDGDSVAVRVPGTALEGCLDRFEWNGDRTSPSTPGNRPVPVPGRSIEAAAETFDVEFETTPDDGEPTPEGARADGGVATERQTRRFARRLRTAVADASRPRGVDLSPERAGPTAASEKTRAARAENGAEPSDEVPVERADAVAAYLDELVTSDVFYDPVVEIESEPYDGPVVGLSVPGTHNYLAGLGACGVNHNTFELPEAQRDRFQFKLTVDMPDRNEERELLSRFENDPTLGPENVEQVVEPETITAAREAVTGIHLDESIREYILDIVETTRTASDVEYGASPRASLAFMNTSKARAAVQGREYVIPDDVKALAEPILEHRLVLSADAELSDVEPADVVDDVLSTVVPPGGDSQTGSGPETSVADGGEDRADSTEETPADESAAAANGEAAPDHDD